MRVGQENQPMVETLYPKWAKGIRVGSKVKYHPYTEIGFFKKNKITNNVH